jgi:hypothetical protein
MKKLIKKIIAWFMVLKLKAFNFEPIPGRDETNWLLNNDIQWSDFTDALNLKEFDKFWLKEQPWGKIHPEYQYQWYDSEMVEIKEDKLILKSKPNFKDIGTIFYETTKSNTQPSYISVGLVTSKIPFNPGHFHFEIELPLDDWTWPAVWTTCFSAWPPEIDLIEAYSGDDNYKNFTRLHSNVHYNNLEGKHLSIESDMHPVYKKRFNLAFTILKDRINFYYEGWLVRTVTDPIILKNIWNDPRQMIIFNHAYTWDIMKKGNWKKVNSEFIIHKFIYKEII